MVLKGAMKRVLSILLGSVITFILGTLLLVPITNKIYMKIMNLSSGPDAENELVGFLILFQWPVFLLIGGILGNWLYKKYLARRNSRKSERGR